jgi:prepilin-type N-terminal cleavage/methylation domain-containing protein
MSHRDQRRNSQGFTLIEIAVVIVIVAVMLAMGAVMFRGVSAAQKRSVTAARLATVDLALVQFVMLNKRLPCPANGTLPSGSASAGVEAPDPPTGTCTGNQQHGVVPWVTLGITETDATDGWGRRLTYRTDVDLVADNGMDMSWCDPAGSEPGPGPKVCNTACSSTALSSCTPPAIFLVDKGLRVRNVSGSTIMDQPNTGAAYVVISHGESGGGAYLSSGALFTSTTTDGTEERRNYANLAASGGVYYVDDATTDVPGPLHFDDIVSRPSVLSLAIKAGLGPRPH